MKQFRVGAAAAVAASVLGLSGVLHAQTSHPMITHTVPLAVQRGTQAEATVHGRQNFAGAFAVHVHGEGVTAEIVPPAEGEKVPENPNNVKLTFTVSDDAVLGPREFRIATAQGVSTVGQIIVTDLPVVVEEGKSATRADARPVEIGNVVSGIVASREEVDYYKFHAKAGQRVVFVVQSARLMFKTHDLQKHLDPILTLHDASGRELDSNDDYYFADPMLSYQFAADGEYYVSVRDVRYDGDPRWTYCLFLTDRPYLTAVHPMAVNVSGSREIAGVGFNLSKETFSLPLPQGIAAGVHTVQFADGDLTTNPIQIEATELPIVEEVEPNDAPEQATAIELPTGVVGRIQSQSDVDLYRLELKKGDAVRFEVKARRNGSTLDSSLRLLNDKGAAIASVDDHQTTKDSLLTAAVPADGEYFLEIKDLLNRGGPSFGYFLDARYDEPNFSLVCDDDKAGVAPGAAAAPWFVKVERTGGFTGPVEVRVEGLPEGVDVNPLTIPESMTQGCLIFSAAENCTPALAAVRVVGKAEIADADGHTTAIERTAAPISEIYVPGGGRGQWSVDTHMVQVHPEADLQSVAVSPERISLKPGEKIELDVEIQRREKYKGRVTLDVRLQHLNRVYADPLPPGVTMVAAGSKTSLNENESKGKIILQASADAKPIENVPVAVLANVSINFVVKRAYASSPVWVEVASPENVAAK